LEEGGDGEEDDGEDGDEDDEDEDDEDDEDDEEKDEEKDEEEEDDEVYLILICMMCVIRASNRLLYHKTKVCNESLRLTHSLSDGSRFDFKDRNYSDKYACCAVLISFTKTNVYKAK